jgi:DNA polymerase-4
LSQHFGKAGEYYYRIVRGQDDRPVNPNRARKSYGAETTFETDLLDTGIMLEHLIGLTERVLAKMRARKECGCTLTLKVKYADFEQVTRSRTLAFPFLQTADVAPHLIALLRRTEAGDRKVRLWGSVFRRWAACLSGRGGSWICLIPVWNSATKIFSRRSRRSHNQPFHPGATRSRGEGVEWPDPCPDD